MNKPHSRSDRYEFDVPTSLKEALARFHSSKIHLLNVEKQLGDKRRARQMEPHEYDTWREKTKAARIFIVAERQFLLEWIRERRRQLDAKKVDIWPVDDPRALLQRAVVEGRKALRGEENELAAVLDAADVYLTHIA